MPKDEQTEFIVGELKDLGERASKIEIAVALSKQAVDQHASQTNRLCEELKRMNDILQENTNSLKDHMAQTAMLKDQVIKMDARISPIEAERLKQTTISDWRWGVIVMTSKIVGFLLGSGGLVWGIIEILGRVHGK